MMEFKDKAAGRVFDQYHKQVDRIIRNLTQSDKKEIKMEITSHLYESMAQDPAEQEMDRLLNAIDKLGELNEYLEPIVADKLIEKASASLSPKTLVQAFIHNFGRSVSRTLLFAVFGLIYFFVVSLAMAGIAKFFIPEIGLYIGAGNFVVGVVEKEGVEEVLGYWITPIAFLLATILYIFSTKILKLLALKK